MEWLNAQDPRTFVDLPEIKEAFISLNMKIKNARPDDAEAFYDKEAMYFKRVIFASYDPGNIKKYLGKCTTFSLYSCFMDIAANGDVLSFNPDDKLCYIEKRGYKAGRTEGGQDIWEDRARLIISPYGELSIRQEMGQVSYADPAVVVFDGDLFKIGTDDRSNVVVHWESKIPRASVKIIGSFIKVTRANESFITFYMLQEDIDRLAGYSARQNRGTANALYGTGENGSGQIDQGFLKAKTLKHALATFPKVKLRGTNSSMDEADQFQENEEGQKGEGLGPARGIPTNVAPYVGTKPQQPNGTREDSWDEPQGKDGGVKVTVEPEEEETF